MYFNFSSNVQDCSDSSSNFQKVSNSASISEKYSSSAADFQEVSEDEESYEKLMVKFQDCSKKLKIVIADLQKLQKENINLKTKVTKLKLKNSMLNSKNLRYQKGVEKYFSPSQKEIFLGAKKVKWDPIIMKKAAILKVTLGNRKIDLLRNFFPFPSSRCLRDNMAKIPFEVGLQEFNLQMLKVEIEKKNLKKFEKSFVLGFDCKALMPGLQYDFFSQKHIGFSTLEPSEASLKKNPQKIATQGLVFVLLGMNPRIKKIADFEYVCSSIKPEAMMEKLIEVIMESERISGIQVDALCCDQGSENLSALLLFGAKFNLHQNNFYIQHPIDPSRKIYILLDLVHVIKNLTCAFRKYRVKFSQSLVKKFNLASNFADFRDVQKLFIKQKSTELKFDPKLTLVVMQPSNFESMREEVAYNLLSDEIINALDILHDDGTGKRNGTAWFLQELSSIPKIYINKNEWSKDNLQSYQSDVKQLNFLKNEFFTNIRFMMDRGSVKSVVGAIISCSSLIAYSQHLFDNGAEKFYPKHCINNATENIFAQISLKSTKPTAEDFKGILKGYSISGLESKCDSNYKFEDGVKFDSSLSPFELAKELQQKEADDDKTSFEEFIELDLSNCKNDAELYPDNFHFISFHKNIATFINSNINLTHDCDTCFQSLQLIQEGSDHCYLSNLARQFFSSLEFLYRELQKKIPISHENFKENFVQNAMNLPVFDHCLHIQEAFINQFLKFRIAKSIPFTDKRRVLKFASKSLSK